MVPTRYEFLEKMPRLSSGKIDRKTLKESPFFRQEIGLDESDWAKTTTTTEAETILFDTVTRLFPGQTIWRSADFFTDLGGNSLMAALFVSTLRQQDPRFTYFKISDVYKQPRLEQIADKMQNEIMSFKSEPLNVVTVEKTEPKKSVTLRRPQHHHHHHHHHR